MSKILLGADAFTLADSSVQAVLRNALAKAAPAFQNCGVGEIEEVNVASLEHGDTLKDWTSHFRSERKRNSVCALCACLYLTQRELRGEKGYACE